jgi:serine/threonine protein kinase
MRLLDIARDQGLITDAQLEMVRAEHTQAVAQGRSKTPTRIAIERGILSDQDAHDLETEAWIRDLPSDLDEYRLVRLVGRGGMAVVFEAQDISLGKCVAVKLLLPEFASSDSYLARFYREARIAARLTHPNTVQVFRAGEKENVQFLVMEFVEGEPISGILRRRGRIPERDALDVAFQVSGAHDGRRRHADVHVARTGARRAGH